MNESRYKFRLALEAMVKRYEQWAADLNAMLAARYGSGVLLVGAWDNEVSTQCVFYDTNLGVPHEQASDEVARPAGA